MKKKKQIEPNSMIGYDEKGEITEYHWQKEPYRVNRGVFTTFKLPWYKKLNPFWRRSMITFKEFTKKINSAI